MDSVEQPHETTESVETQIITPGHDPRVETPEYQHAHHQLVYELDKPCYICGITHSGGGAMETHHYPIERSLMNACDWKKVHADFPQVVSQQTFEQFVDSAANLLVLCATHHTGPNGIHHVLHADWVVQKYAKDGYIFFPDSAGLAADEQHDASI